MRILELFSGIGAVAVAAQDSAEIAYAFDINQSAMQIYRANFNSPSQVQEITSLSDSLLSGFDDCLWWMSPPCQPFTRRGLQKDTEDDRTKPLLRLVSAIEKIRPIHVALENVIGFENSKTHDILVASLDRAGYSFSSTELSSSDFGLPNLRPRFFLAASRATQPKLELEPPTFSARKTVADFLDSDVELSRWGKSLFVDPKQIVRYADAINVVRPDSDFTRCFTSAYGRSIVRSGSYLETEHGFRRFSPTEQCRLLGFPRDFQFPSDMSALQLWKLIGNTVSIPCARHVLGSFSCDNILAF
jgi:site-specific DNA-cytosine methylase